MATIDAVAPQNEPQNNANAHKDEKRRFRFATLDYKVLRLRAVAQDGKKKRRKFLNHKEDILWIAGYR